MDKKIIQKAGKYFTETEKHQIIQELISSQCTKVEKWEKYTGFGSNLPRPSILVDFPYI